MKSNAMEAAALDTCMTMIRINPVTFAKRLADARDAAGVTQAQIAAACNISNRTISAWEKGKVDGVLADNLFAVADYLHVDARYLATGEIKDAKPVTVIISNWIPAP